MHGPRRRTHAQPAGTATRHSLQALPAGAVVAVKGQCTGRGWHCAVQPGLQACGSWSMLICLGDAREMPGVMLYVMCNYPGHEHY